MSQSTGVRTRKALNDLQYCSNGKDIIGLSPRKTNNLPLKTKMVETDNPKLTKMKKRTSISLPDIAGTIYNEKKMDKPPKSATVTSTPNKTKRASTTTTPTKFNKKDISIIIEEKENPGYFINSSKVVEAVKPAVELKKAEVKEFGVQCNKGDEDMLFNDNIDDTCYFKLLAHKRCKAQAETLEENKELNNEISDLDRKNNGLREEIEQLVKLVEQAKEINRAIMESIENDDSEDEDDSGYEPSHLLNQTK